MSRIRFVKLSPWIPPWIDRILDYGDEPWGTDPFYSIVHGTADTLASGLGYGVGSAIGLAIGAPAGPTASVAAGLVGGQIGAEVAPIIIEESALALAETIQTEEMFGVPFDVHASEGRGPMPVGFTGWTHGGGPVTQNLASGFSNPQTDQMQAIAFGGMFVFLNWFVRTF